MAPELTPEQRKTAALKAASTAATKASKALEDRDRTMRLARQQGASLREISDATNIPHVTVSRIIDRLDEGHTLGQGLNLPTGLPPTRPFP